MMLQGLHVTAPRMDVLAYPPVCRKLGYGEALSSSKVVRIFLNLHVDGTLVCVINHSESLINMA